jgi:hypothetical protein
VEVPPLIELEGWLSSSRDGWLLLASTVDVSAALYRVGSIPFVRLVS